MMRFSTSLATVLLLAHQCNSQSLRGLQAFYHLSIDASFDNKNNPNHPGMYFRFDPSDFSTSFQLEFSDPEDEGLVVPLTQCRMGQPIYNGEIIFWEGDLMASHGRRHPDFEDGDFLPGDTLIPSGKDCSAPLIQHGGFIIGDYWDNPNNPHTLGEYFKIEDVDAFQLKFDPINDPTDSGVLFSAKQCRSGRTQPLFLGRIRVWNGPQMVPHGRKEENPQTGDFQPGDVLVHPGDSCEDELESKHT